LPLILNRITLLNSVKMAKPLVFCGMKLWLIYLIQSIVFPKCLHSSHGLPACVVLSISLHFVRCKFGLYLAFLMQVSVPYRLLEGLVCYRLLFFTILNLLV
jgi:hypothetical protein